MGKKKRIRREKVARKNERKAQGELVDSDVWAAALDAVRDEYVAALEREDLGEIELVKLRARCAAKFHGLRSVVLAERGEHDDATKAAAQAAKAEDSLIRAGKADVITRVELLEQRVGEARTGGAMVRGLKSSSKPPPGADPRRDRT